MKIESCYFGLVFFILMMNPVAGLDLFGFLKENQQSTPGLEVTVYNSDLGVVKEVTDLSLSEGVGWHSYVGVASGIDPTSVKLRSLDGSFAVLEQNYEYDLVSKQKILEKYLGENIKGYLILGEVKEPVEGRLLASAGNELILEKASGQIQIVSVDNLLLPSLPSGLVTKPTLNWMIRNKGAGNKTAELSYMTSGLSWMADYVLVSNEEDTQMDLNGWVTVTNNAGKTFENATLKLVAGDVNRVTAPQARYKTMDYTMEAVGSVNQFSQQQLFEYHMYNLDRKTTLKDRQQKQVSLFEALGAPIEKEYIYENTGGWWRVSEDSKKIQVKLNFDNKEENGLGMPLPKGRVRVFKYDKQGLLQFVGEDSIDHTPKDETLRILVGSAFDIVGERKQMNVEDLGCQYEVTWEVTLRNHKDEDVVVTVLENAYWDWEIVYENHEHQKESNQKIKWRVPVPADGESTLTYTIRYNHC
ncbi:MAG: DUF4139 domain-containing protein [Candidatus Altiarchaeales archaeon]|nr:DUF4139 domain-containing protein [Candidatus Altiarchaeales archaeon]